jgi:hypothetical protein
VPFACRTLVWRLPLKRGDLRNLWVAHQVRITIQKGASHIQEQRVHLQSLKGLRESFPVKKTGQTLNQFQSDIDLGIFGETQASSHFIRLQPPGTFLCFDPNSGTAWHCLQDRVQTIENMGIASSAEQSVHPTLGPFRRPRLPRVVPRWTCSVICMVSTFQGQTKASCINVNM